MMTVKELIDALQLLPKDAEIMMTYPTEFDESQKHIQEISLRVPSSGDKIAYIN